MGLYTRRSVCRCSTPDLCALSGAGDGAGQFLLQLVLFPATELFPREDFGVVAPIARFTTILNCGIVNLFAHPSLPLAYGRAAIATFVSVTSIHLLPTVLAKRSSRPRSFSRRYRTARAPHPSMHLQLIRRTTKQRNTSRMCHALVICSSSSQPNLRRDLEPMAE